jgi:hypothetical protein
MLFRLLQGCLRSFQTTTGNIIHLTSSSSSSSSYRPGAVEPKRRVASRTTRRRAVRASASRLAAMRAPTRAIMMVINRPRTAARVSASLSRSFVVSRMVSSMSGPGCIRLAAVERERDGAPAGKNVGFDPLDVLVQRWRPEHGVDNVRRVAREEDPAGGGEFRRRDDVHVSVSLPLGPRSRRDQFLELAAVRRQDRCLR